MAVQALDFPSTPLSREIAKRHKYPEYMIRRFLALIPDAEEMIRIMEIRPPAHIRVNTLKITEEKLLERLQIRGFELEPHPLGLPHSYVIVDEPYSVGASSEHLQGYFYLQDAASLVPSLALAPEPGHRVLDMAAAPGGKTTHISQLMDNRGVVVAVDRDRKRVRALVDNVNRMGARNAVVFRMDARDVASLDMMFDRVLLDAPCTGEGVIPRDPTRKASRGISDILYCSENQRELIDAAVSILSKDGVLVYSTCSFTPEEDELVVDYAIREHGLTVEPILWGDPAFTRMGDVKVNGEIRNARRFYPHRHGTIGFFVAKLRWKR